MKTYFYLNNKKVTKKFLKEQLGEETVKRYIKEAKEQFFEDPLTYNQFYAKLGFVVVEFR